MAGSDQREGDPSCSEDDATKQTVAVAAHHEANGRKADTSKSESLLMTAQEAKERGNELFKAGKLDEAIMAYREGLDIKDELEGSDISLEAALRSNLAMMLLKKKSWSEAAHECDVILDTLHVTSNPKVWYRRALAREGQRRYDEAVDDLKSGLKLFPNETDTEKKMSKTDGNMYKATRAALSRILELAKKGETMTTKPVSVSGDESTPHLSHDVELPVVVTPDATKSGVENGRYHTTQNGFADNHRTRIQPPHPIPQPPSPTEQRQQITRLLLNRKTLLETTPAREKDETFYIIDWAWWRHWCSYVDMFAMKGKNVVGKGQSQLLRLFPSGTIIPPPFVLDDDDDDEVADDDEEEHDDKRVGGKNGTKSNAVLPPPSPINNSRLFRQAEDPMHRQWYDTTQELEPNLVRGHHYEVLSRELFSALSCWYGCSSPIIRRCKRASDGHLSLYGNRNMDDVPASSSVSPDKPRTNGVDTTATSYESATAGALNKCSACGAHGAKCRCQQCQLVFYCSRSCQESHWPFHKLQCKRIAAASPGDAQLIPVDIPPSHRVGLYNLGNTCFMNSALQCLAHATPLTRHFLSNDFKTDLNTRNPLGTQGRLAHAYEVVLKDLWLKRHDASSPTALKRAIAMFAPRFAGTSQHDAQEFLAYLLDGLHEDLNRIREAPYVEMPDVSEDDNMHIAGVEAWERHQLRNNSLVMDSFYGQFKSTCVCPRCQRTSTSFDAFNHISLEIPQQKTLPRFLPLILMEQHGPVRYMVQVPRAGFVGDLVQIIHRDLGLPIERIILCDVYEGSIFELLQNNKKLSTIRQSDVIVVYNADPYSLKYIHTIATHVVWEKGATENDDGTLPGGEDIVMRRFGFPLLTSFDVNMTCRQVWDYIWSQIACYISDAEREYLTIKVTDNTHQPRELFPVEEKDAGQDPESVLPPDNDEKIASFLGESCAESFLFLSLEWNKKRDHEIVIDQKKFEEVVDHQTYGPMLLKQRKVLQDQKGVSLDQCFETFTRPERLDENNMWYCNKCKEHVQAMKTMELWRLPNILVIHLKRFEFKNTFRRDKLDTFVDCPLEGLDMSQYCSSYKIDRDSFVVDDIPAEYDLFAVTNHYGRLGFGHYTAFARRWDEDGMSKDWYLFDDASVQNVGDGKSSPRGGVVSSAAYVLFYRRRRFV